MSHDRITGRTVHRNVHYAAVGLSSGAAQFVGCVSRTGRGTGRELHPLRATSGKKDRRYS
jgi:hypothetical protein